jgi:multiple sugar transport system permease protein
MIAMRSNSRIKKSSARPSTSFTLPTWILLTLTIIFPLGYGIYLSFLNVNLGSFLPTEFVGLENYRLALRASETYSTLITTIQLMVVGLGIQIPLGILLALVIHQSLKGSRFFRSILIVPMLLTPVAVGLIFRFMFDTDIGIINWILSNFGAESVNWLGSRNSALLAIIIVDSWQSVPFVMLLMLAALAGIPTSIYEAAIVDGANKLQTFFRITLPLIVPTLLVLTMIKIMDFLKLFDTLFILTRGGPGNETTTLGLWTYKTGFIFLEMSRAAALGVIIVILTMPVYILWRKSSKSVRT